MAHMAFWTVAKVPTGLKVSFRQGDDVKDCGGVPYDETEQLIAWMFHAADGAQQYDHVHAPFVSGWVLETNCEAN